MWVQAVSLDTNDRFGAVDGAESPTLPLRTGYITDSQEPSGKSTVCNSGCVRTCTD